MYQQYMEQVQERKEKKGDEREQRIKHEQAINAYMKNEMTEIEKLEKENAQKKH